MFPANWRPDEGKSLRSPGTKTRFARPNRMKARLQPVRPPNQSIGRPFRFDSFDRAARPGPGQKVKVLSWGVQRWIKPIRKA